MTLAKQLDSTIDTLCNIKQHLKAGNVHEAWLAICGLETPDQQSLAILSLEKQNEIEHITCDDYPPLMAFS